MSNQNFNINKLISNNNYVNAFVAVIIIFYASYAAPNLPNSVVKIFKLDIIKLFLIFLIAYIATKNTMIAIIASIAFIITLQTINRIEIQTNISQLYNDIKNNQNFQGTYLNNDINPRDIVTSSTHFSGIPPFKQSNRVLGTCATTACASDESEGRRTTANTINESERRRTTTQKHVRFNDNDEKWSAESIDIPSSESYSSNQNKIGQNIDLTDHISPKNEEPEEYNDYQSAHFNAAIMLDNKLMQPEQSIDPPVYKPKKNKPCNAKFSCKDEKPELSYKDSNLLRNHKKSPSTFGDWTDKDVLDVPSKKNIVAYDEHTCTETTL